MEGKRLHSIVILYTKRIQRFSRHRLENSPGYCLGHIVQCYERRPTHVRQQVFPGGGPRPL